MAKKKPVKIPGFKAVAVLGKGAQGVVYKGIHLASKAPVAIKVLSPKMARIPEFKTRFLRESSAALSLSHPNIVKALKAGEEGGLLYYVMEFAEGKALSDVGSSPLEEKRIIHLGIQAADALAYAHERGLVHRDVKPGNFILSSRGTLKLLDLGLAKQQQSGEELTVAGSVFGTPNYISPEGVHDSKAVDARSDIFSLGATLYRLAAGKPPFTGVNAVMIMDQVCNHPPAPLRDLNPGSSEGLEEVILKAMAKQPDQRYANCLDLKTDLVRLKEGKPPLRAGMRPRGKRKASGRSRAAGSGRRSSRRTARRGFLSRMLGWFSRK